jgi:hypothetical protein
MAFDVDSYARTATPVRWDDVDLDAFCDRPLSPGALRVLRYMCDVEGHTVCYLRDLLLTPSHTDPEITTFLTMWNYEEHWHGEVLADVLAAHGVATDEDHVRMVRTRQGWKDKVAPITQSVLANVIGEDFVATHMTWGAINEWCTFAGYQRLSAIEDHPVLTEVLGRIAKQETRHIAFYASQARARLGRSRKAQRVTRFALRAAWNPVGSGVMPEPEVQHLLTYLMGGPEGREHARRIDQRIHQLPGLAGMDLVVRALDAHRIPA